MTRQQVLERLLAVTSLSLLPTLFLITNIPDWIDTKYVGFFPNAVLFHMVQYGFVLILCLYFYWGTDRVDSQRTAWFALLLVGGISGFLEIIGPAFWYFCVRPRPASSAEEDGTHDV